MLTSYTIIHSLNQIHLLIRQSLVDTPGKVLQYWTRFSLNTLANSDRLDHYTKYNLQLMKVL